MKEKTIEELMNFSEIQSLGKSDRWIRFRLDFLVSKKFLQKKGVKLDTSFKPVFKYYYKELAEFNIPSFEELTKITSNTSYTTTTSNTSNTSNTNTKQQKEGVNEVNEVNETVLCGSKNYILNGTPEIEHQKRKRKKNKDLELEICSNGKNNNIYKNKHKTVQFLNRSPTVPKVHKFMVHKNITFK